jgi:hypothetical protein
MVREGGLGLASIRVRLRVRVRITLHFDMGCFTCNVRVVVRIEELA